MARQRKKEANLVVTWFTLLWSLVIYGVGHMSCTQVDEDTPNPIQWRI